MVLPKARLISDNSRPMNTPPDKVLDTTGLICPEPLMLLHNAMRQLESGQIIDVIATDPSTNRDITKFCTYLGHELMVEETQDSKLYFRIKKS